MDTINFTSIAFSTIPALITGGVAYYFFKSHVKNEDNRRNFLLVKQGQKITLPARLQAYERITLLLERINPSQLLIRVKPLGDNKEAYKSLLLKSIEQEYEHNLSQQIYLTEECWNIITSSKNAISKIISDITKQEAITNSQELREHILKKMMDTTPPSSVALSFLKAEVSKLL